MFGLGDDLRRRDANEELSGNRVAPAELLGLRPRPCSAPPMRVAHVSNSSGSRLTVAVPSTTTNENGGVVVVDAQRDAAVAQDRLPLDRVVAGREHHVVAVEHEPDRHDVRARRSAWSRPASRCGCRRSGTPGAPGRTCRSPWPNGNLRSHDAALARRRARRGQGVARGELEPRSDGRRVVGHPRPLRLRGADVPRGRVGQGLAARPRRTSSTRRSPSTARSVRPRASATCSPRRRSSRTATSGRSAKTCCAS